MKKYYLLLLFLLFSILNLSAQTTETFETATPGAATFTSNGQVFNITSVAPATFDIFSDPTAYGWNGTAADFRFIDNTGSTGINVPVEFTVAAVGGAQFTLKSMYLYISNYNLQFGGLTGSVTITAKLGGTTVYTATASSGFNNSASVAKGFTFIDMTTYGGNNNSTSNIDSFTIKTSGSIAYIALDALRWQAGAAAVAPTVTTAPAIGVGSVKATLGGNVTSDGGGTVTDRGIVWGIVPNPTTAGNKVQIGTGSGVFSGVVSSLPPGTTINYRAYAINTAGTSYGANTTFTTGAALSATQSQTDVTCAGGSDGAASVTASGGKTPYTYAWTTGESTASISGLIAGSYTALVTDAEGTSVVKNFTITQSSASAISISANPPNRTVCPGFSTTFNASALNASTYQWQVNTGSGFVNITNGGVYSNATTTSLALTGVTAGMTGYTYRLVASGPCSPSATSNSGTLTVPNITVGISSQTNVACNGGNTGAATVSASGGFAPYTYSWAPSGGTAATATGLTAQTYTVTITDNISCTKTQTVTITEPTLAASSPAISTQPASASACTGSNATFSVTATNTASYQWQVDQGAGYVNITNGGSSPAYSGATTASLGVSSVTSGMNGYAYRVVLTSSCSNTIASNGLAQLNVTSLPVATATPALATICSGASPNIALTSTPGGATFAWTVATTSGTVSGASASSGTSINQTLTGNGVVTYTVTPTLNSCPGTPITIPITVNGAPAITAQPSSSIICAGANTTFSVTADNVTGYQWQVDQGAGFANVSNIAPYSGATTATLTITGASAGLNGYVYRVVATGTCTPNAVSNATTLTINSAPAVTTQPSASAICVGANTTFSAVVSGATGYQWQVDQGAGFSNVLNIAPYSGATTATLTITGATIGLNGYVYRVVATGACTPAAVSNTAALTVNPAPSIVTQPNNSITCLTGNTTFSVTATNATGYQWQVNQGAGFSNVPNIAPYSGTTTATLTLTGVTAIMNGYVYRVIATGACTPNAVSAARTLTVPAIVSNASQTNISCNGFSNGTATVAPTGGTSPYTYLWSNGAITASITGIPAGSYSVTITDANLCQKTQNFTITQPPVLVASQGTINNVSCFNGTNGSATVNVTGGTPGYTYSWSPSGGTAATASGLQQGTYIVTVTDANSCTTTQSFTINQPTDFSVTQSQTNLLCNGAATGSASVVVTGGTGSYTYSWSPTGGTAATATGLTAGNYIVTITDANTCSTTSNFTLTEPVALVASQGAITNINCYGDTTGSATVNVTGGTGNYTYSWAPSGGTAATATGLSAGIYTVTITDDNLCTTTQAFTITQPAAMLSASTASTGVSCFGGSNGSASVTVSGGTPGYTYLWAPLGGTTSSISGKPAGNYTCTITDSKGCTLVKNITISTPNAFSATYTKTDVSCNGLSNGSATVTATGATAPYTYSWSPSGGTAATASGLTAGNYTVTVSDANTCSYTVSVTINQPAALTATQSQTDVLCNGSSTGTATVTVTGGTTGYTYLWSPTGGTAATATGLASGNYSCLITDANGCILTKNFFINEPAILAATQSQINATCVIGGQAAVNVSGGTLPYTYLWSPTGLTTAIVTGLAAGNHSVLITDANGCTVSKNFTINTTNTLTAVQSQTDVLCNGASTGSATVVPSGAPGPFTYVWAPSGGTAATANNLAAGNYSVIITSANGCSTVKNFTITQPSAFVVTPTQTNVACNGGVNGSATVNVTGGTGAYTYAWAPSGGTAATASGLSAGTYTVTITDANLCQTTQSFTITEPTAIVATTSQTNVSCNSGTNGSATVNATGGTGAYTYSWSPTGGNAATASGLAAGNYSVTITDANTCSTTLNVTITEPAILAATIAKTDVSCNGASDGTATVSATGGTGAYTYSWLPSGGTAATATGLSPNTYIVTVTDANLCSTTQTVNIITTPDVTAPVPVVATLPTITNFCAVLPSQIAIPKAIDNCAGTINGTTTDPLTYNAQGTYTITWKYDDGNGNITTQSQTVIVSTSPLNAVTFTNAQFAYDGTAHALQVANLPAGATVSYSANNASINVGTYVITATVTPSASTPNCTPVVLTANLVITKAAQLITFSPIAIKTLGLNNTFNLTATSSSNLPVTYTFTYTSALAPATVTAAGAVTMVRSGQLTITAHQAGNSNYLPATDVSQLLVILNNNVDVQRITLGTKIFNNPGKVIYQLLACGETNPNVSVQNGSNAVITPSANFTIQTPKPGIYTQNVVLTSEDGSLSATYSITVEKPFGFFDIVHQKFNNVLLVNNNPQTNGGYEFVSYQWFKNGQLIGTGQYYSAGEDITNTLDPTADYSVKMTTKDGKVLQTCTAKITTTNTLKATLYPNPIETGKMITIDADFPKEELENMQISIYSTTGQLVKTVKSSSEKTEIQLPQTTESNMYLVVLETPNIKRSFKVIVK